MVVVDYLVAPVVDNIKDDPNSIPSRPGIDYLVSSCLAGLNYEISRLPVEVDRFYFTSKSNHNFYITPLVFVLTSNSSLVNL